MKPQPRAVTVQTVTITNPDKVMYPESGITKGMVAEYYRAVSARMLPHVQNRLLSTVRCPRGIGGPCFFRRHPADGKGVEKLAVTGSGGQAEEYFYLTDARGLIDEVRMDTLEFHTWASRVQTLEQPDVMVFDLDPDKGMGVEQVRQGVRDVKRVLDARSLVSYLKTSGGKGYHIVVPLRPSAGWQAFHNFARGVAREMEERWPGRYTADARKDRRQGRIFVDWLRNSKSATTVAPYSVRAREGAPVSMPIAWEELDAITPRSVTLANAAERLRQSDPWADFFTRGQRIE